MKALILLVPLLAVVAAQTTCECDFTTRAVMCKGLNLTDFQKKDSGCEYAFWKIDLSQNSLQEFPEDLQQFLEVNMSLNSLEHLEASTNQYVMYLDVSKNSILEIDLGNKFLSLRHLIAANNYLGLLDDFFDGQCNVEHLDVSGNKIKSLDTITRCAYLSILEASGNNILQISKKLVFLTNLRELYLSKNKIIEVSYLPLTLGLLDISENYIQRVSESSFRGLASLQGLDLSFNTVSVIEKGAFATLSSLQLLSLKATDLQFLSSEIFKGLKSLKRVDLSSNRIEFLFNNTFSDLSALEEVFLELNEFSTLPPLQFGKKVMNISFNSNSMTKMDLSALLTMFSGSEDKRHIYLLFNNFRGDDPEWSYVLKYFEGHCSEELVQNMQEKLSGKDHVKYTLAPSPCACAIFAKDSWRFGACISDGAEVDGLPWLEAAKMYAGIKEEDGRRSKFKRYEL